LDVLNLRIHDLEDVGDAVVIAIASCDGVILTSQHSKGRQIHIEHALPVHTIEELQRLQPVLSRLLEGGCLDGQRLMVVNVLPNDVGQLLLPTINIHCVNAEFVDVKVGGR